MVTAQKVSVSQKQGICKQLVALMEKRYGKPPKRQPLDALDTLLFAIAIENTTPEYAERALQRLKQGFFDYNEARVSSVSELERIFDEDPDAAWKGLRVRTALQYVFDRTYSFDLDDLKRMSLQQAEAELRKVQYLTPFARLYTLQQLLGSHLVPLDDRMRRAAAWLGFISPTADPEQAAAQMKSVIRKADSTKFCDLLRCLCADPEFLAVLDEDLPLDALAPTKPDAANTESTADPGTGSKERGNEKSSSAATTSSIPEFSVIDAVQRLQAVFDGTRKKQRAAAKRREAARRRRAAKKAEQAAAAKKTAAGKTRTGKTTAPKKAAARATSKSARKTKPKTTRKTAGKATTRKKTSRKTAQETERKPAKKTSKKTAAKKTAAKTSTKKKSTKKTTRTKASTKKTKRSAARATTGKKTRKKR
ncbi:MAG: hypothetical protein D6725_06985 [Planctomycetota bacterium]|nr:MAG: hypothetical protein D6725_06985 [Planctomycetota bacterium]